MVYMEVGSMKLFLVLNRISHSFALFTREIFWSTLEINFIFPHTMYYSLFISFTSLKVGEGLIFSREFRGEMTQLN